QLLRAAEQLFAEHGIANTPTRTITQAAGQRNESALHYHFGGRHGLISALHEKRTEQIQSRRLEILHTELEKNAAPPLRKLCEIMLQPIIELAREDNGFIDYLKIIGEIAFNTRQDLTNEIKHHETRSLQEIRPLVAKHLKHVPKQVAHIRIETIARFIIMSISQRAHQTEPFQGDEAALYLNNIIDNMAAMLAAEVSPATLGSMKGEG
ncbi:MAG: helix-turn-helix domain-containing protein, partial [Pseudomonadota bacterium]